MIIYVHTYLIIYNNLASHFNFKTFIPKWITHSLKNKLVLYYLLGNTLIYIPFGMYIRYHKKRMISVILFICLIILFEIIQGVTNLGYFDIDDILLNGIGGILGILIMDIYKNIKKTDSKKMC